MVWLIGAFVAYLTGATALVVRMRRERVTFAIRPVRHFAVLFATPHIGGMIATAVLFRLGHAEALPPLWLVFYGIGAVGAGLVSDRIVSILGAIFIALGALAALSPERFGDWCMLAGFGGCHIFAGVFLIRRARRVRET